MDRVPATLGIDLGTSAVKAVLVDGAGAVLAASDAPLGLACPEPGAAEQDPWAWWTAVRHAVRACLDAAVGAEVAAVGLTGQKHALLLLDDVGRPLGRAVIWADARASVEAAELDALAARRGGRPRPASLPGHLLPKWRRLVRTRPDDANRARALLFAKDWLGLRLTGGLATDRTEASTLPCYDPRRRGWSADAARGLGLPPRLLPPVLDPRGRRGPVSPEAAAETGLPAGIPVVAGAGDNEAAQLALGALDPGVLAVTLGTSGTVIGVVPRRRVRAGLVSGDTVGARRVAGTGVVLAAGRALVWVRDLAFGGATPVEAVIRRAADLPPEEDVPTFLPSLEGERSPVPDPGARGAFAGLSPAHGPVHFARAVLDGVAAALGETIELFRADGQTVAEVRITGGGARAEVWRAGVAAAAAAPVRLVGGSDATARGAALLAHLERAGERTLLDTARRWVEAGPLEVPSRTEVERMGRLRARQAALRGAVGPAAPTPTRAVLRGGA